MRVGTVGQETVPMKCAESRNFRLYGSMGCHRRPLRKKEEEEEEERRKQYKNTTSRSSFAAQALMTQKEQPSSNDE